MATNPYRSKYGFSVGATNPGTTVVDTDLNVIANNIIVGGKVKINSAGRFFLEVADIAPTNAISATNTLSALGAVGDGMLINIGATTYEVDSNGSVLGDNIPIDVSAGTKSQASGTYTIEDKLQDGDIISIGDEAYEIDFDGVVADGNYSLDLSQDAVAAQAVLTISGPAADGDLVSINGVTLEMDEDGQVAEGHKRVDISDGQSAADCVTALKIVINSIADIGVTAKDGDGETVVVTAVKPGSEGNNIPVSVQWTADAGSWGTDVTTLEGGIDADGIAVCNKFETVFAANTQYEITVTNNGDGSFTLNADAGGAQDGAAGNLPVSTTATNASWSNTSLSGGSDATNLEFMAAFALAAAEDEIVSVVDNEDGTATITALVAGTAGNEIATTTNVSSLEFDKDTLEGGTNGTPGLKGEVVISDGKIYICMADNDELGTNWYEATLTQV